MRMLLLLTLQIRSGFLFCLSRIGRTLVRVRLVAGRGCLGG